MYISKELALILKEKGFNEDTTSFYSHNELLIRQSLYYYNDSNWYYTAAPTEHQVINWIFKDVKVNKYFLPTTIEWLQFWYITLLEHKFNLMYEFIGRLEEWFVSNNIFIQLYIEHSTFGYITYPIPQNKPLNNSGNTIYKSKQQAKHKAILECFELMKENTNDDKQ